jgi:hypothetical protein
MNSKVALQPFELQLDPDPGQASMPNDAQICAPLMHSIRHVGEHHCTDESDASDLPRGSRLELYRQLNRHAPRWATTVFHVYALCPGPLADCGAVQPAPRRLRVRSALAEGLRSDARAAATQRASASRIVRPCSAFRWVSYPCGPGELDGIVSLAAVKVIDEQRLYFLGHHVCSVPVSGLGKVSIPHRLDV